MPLVLNNLSSTDWESKRARSSTEAAAENERLRQFGLSMIAAAGSIHDLDEKGVGQSQYLAQIYILLIHFGDWSQLGIGAKRLFATLVIFLGQQIFSFNFYFFTLLFFFTHFLLPFVATYP